MAINPFDLARQLGGVPIGGGESKSADPIELARQLGGVAIGERKEEQPQPQRPQPERRGLVDLTLASFSPNPAVSFPARAELFTARPGTTTENLGQVFKEIAGKAKSSFFLGGADSLPESTSQLPPGMTYEELASMRMTPQDFWRSQGINSDAELKAFKRKKQGELKEDIVSADRRIAALTPKDITPTESAIRQGLVSAGTNVAGITAAVATKSPGVGLGFAGAITGLDSYGEARVKGASPFKAASKAGVDAAIEVYFERYGTKHLADILRKTGLGKAAEPEEIKSALLKFAKREIPAEQLTTAAQSLSDVAFGLDQEMSNAQSIGEIARIQAERQAATLISTVVAGGLQGAGFSAVQGAQQTMQARKLEGALRELETRQFANEQERLEAYRSVVLKQATDIAAPTVRELRPESGQPISPEQYGKTYANKVYGAVGNFIPGNTQFSVEKKETDGKTEFTVKDQSGRQYGQVFENDANANSFAEGLNELSRARAEGIKALEPLSASLRETLTGFGLNDIGLSLGNKVFNREGETLTSEGMYDPMVRRIFLAVDAIDPTGTLDTEQRRQALRGVLRHETVHALRNLDLWKNSEWKNLERAASTLRRTDNGKTYLENAQELYADQNAVVQVEEAVAELIRDVANRLPNIGGKPRTLSERAINFFDKTKNALTGAGFQTYEDVVRKFESGQVGSRQRDRIRTYRATEEYLASRPQNPVLPERIQSLLSTPQGRQEWRRDAVQSVMDKAKVDASANPVAANAASINGLRESRSAIELIPQTIEVNGRKFPTRDSEGRLIYSGYEGEEAFGLPTLPTLEGLQRFWEFAGDTKIVDDAGRPLVYMHGTSADIVAFKPKQAASVFLARPPKFAEEFAYLSEDYMVGNFPDFIPDAQVLDALNESLRSGGGFTPKSYDVLTKARDMAAQDIAQGKGIRPAALKTIKDEAKRGASSVYLNSIMKRLPSGPNLMPVYINAKKPWDYENRQHVDAVVKRARENGADVTGTMVQEIREGNWQTIEGSGDNAPILDAIRELGFDAMYVEEAGYKNLGVFDPAQIKSAIGNNGEFSPLTPSIRESRVRNPQIDTPEFKEFFRDSKVVDGSLTREGLGSGGNPLVVYHATNADIKAFRVGTQGGALGNGIYFSPSTSYVEQYAGAEGGNIIPAYVSIQNPLVIDFSIHPDPMVEALIRLGVKESSAEKIVERAYDTKGYITNQVKKRAADAGFDGIIQYRENGRMNEVVAFYPTQVKSAIGNAGTFSRYSPDIRESRRSINSLLKRYGIEPNNIIEAERMFADGMPMYAIHEQGGPPFEITSVEALRNYTTDQLFALPVSVLGAKESRNASKDAFESKLIEDNRVPDFKSREKLIDMPIGDFLRLAKYGRYDPKYAETSRLLQAGKKFTSLPFLNVSLDEDGILKVMGHEGRHRAMALEDAGYTSMPVILRTMDPNPIRWSEQNDPTRMDYVEDWPTAIEAQGGLFRVPMPVAREDSMAPYGGPSARESRKSGKMGVDTQSNIERAAYEADRVAGQAGRAAEDLARRAGAVAFREARPSKPPVRPGAGRQRREQEVPSGRPREPVNIRPIQDGASTYAAVHYGNVADLAKLSGAKYGTGIRGAEAARLRNSKDARIKRRVYFYINKAGMSEPIRPEAGVGSNVYTQVFNNILGPGERMYEISEQAKNDNDFESLVIKNGFDGYAAPSKGMIVLLGVDAPVRYEGTVADMRAKGVSYREMTSLAARESRSQAPITNALRVARTGFKDYASSSQEQFFGNFWPKIIGSTLGQVSPNPENVRVAVEKSINDLRPWLARNPKYLDYYNKDFAATRRMLETKYGPLTEDQFMMFRLLSGLTSPSTELPDNISDALKAFDVWNQDGNFDSFVMGRSPKGNTVLMSAPFTLTGKTLSNKARTFKVIERLINEKGGVIKAVNFLKEQVPVRELHNFNIEMGYSGPVGDIGAIKGLVMIATGQSELIPRMFIFGPKVGAYVLNMTGESRYNTVDIWESRLIRSYFTGLFSERYGLPENVSEHELFQDFISTFKEVFEQQTGKQWDSSALQAIRWFFIIDAARKAGYTEARTNETISEYVRRNIESPRASSPYRRGQGDEGIGREVPSIRESRPESERAGVRGGRGEGGGIAPLEGAPNVRGGGPIPEIVGIAERYAEESGIPYQRQPSYVEVDEARATRIAEAFEAMRHDPKNPEVLAAYRDMIRQTRAQYNALVDAGYKFTFFDGNTDPYNGNPWNAMRDLRDNKSMAVYGTYDGYGTAGITDSELENNPMLEDTGIRWLDQNGVSRMVTANDLFRAVHDAFGHGIEGAGFRARGEENAWQAHARLFTGPALAALTSETRGQNSWLNFNPKPFREIVGDEKAKQLHPDNWETITAGEHNRTAQLFDTVFAENKIGMMPEWTWQEGFDAPKPRESRVRMSVGQGTPIGPQQPGPSTDTSNTAASGALNDGQPTDSMGIPVGPTITSMMPDGTVSIQDARVPPIMSKLMLRVIESATDRLRRGIGLDDLADRIERYYNGYSARLGLVNGIIRDAMEKIGFREKKLAMATFEQYMRERENGRTAEAEDIYDNATEAGRALIDAWNKIAVETGRINTSLVTRDGKPLRVFDPKIGGWREIGVVKNFFPRTFSQEVMQVMKNPDTDPALYKRLLDALVAGGFAKDTEDAKDYILREWFSDEVKQDYFAAVEKARSVPLPEIFYDYSWDAAVRYMNKWARRTSQIEQFGQKISQFENDWFDTNIPKVRDDRTQAYLNDIKKIIYENETFDGFSNLMAYLNSIATATQLGNPVSAFQNLLGGTVSSAQEFGLKEVGKAYFELVRDWKNVQRTGTTLGILNTDVMRILSDHVERESDKYFSQEQKVSMALAKFANVMLTFGGYNGAENIVRAMTLIAAQGRLNSFLRDANNNLNSKNVRNFMEWAKRQRIDTDALLIEDGQGPETERYIRRAVNVPQGSYKIDMTPVFVDQPIGRFLFKYQKFGTQMNRFFYQNFLKPFADKPSPRNFFRIVSFLGIAVLGGTAMLAFREALGYGDPGPDDEELKKALENKDTSRFFSLMFSRAWQSIMAAGSFGFFGNYAQLAYDWQDQQRVKNPLSPPGLSSVNGVADIINRGMDQKKFTARDLDEVMEANLSAYRAGKRATLATADGFGSDAREVRRFAAMRDQREIDEYTRRYASEMDIEFKRRTAPGAIVRTPMTPVNKEITDALRQGDSARARALIRQATREVPFSERERVERSIKASVRNRQPIRIGGSAPSAEQKEQFLKWARRNLPIETYRKIVSADRQYSNAANRAGVGFSGED